MDPFVGEIRIVAFNFAPRGWALCNGQLMPISQNTALYSILGTQYGGDGKNTFALPDLMGRAAVHQGDGPGLTSRRIGEKGGASTVTLLQNQMPMHIHVASASETPDSQDPTGKVWADVAIVRGVPNFYSTADAPNVQMSVQALQATGGSTPHNNMQPYLAMNFVIALEGVFPQRP